ncbi:MAG: phosphoadenylyl-sulfate reductase [Hyphomonadaceae bacterium]|nr:MAG: phosphoadenylyl-sulfate reductase [Hyphomonadaceae bacterium]
MNIQQISETLNGLALPQRLAKIRELAQGRITFSTSFGLEDQLITHHIATQKLAVDIFTLDTGRLFQEVHDLWQATEDKYGISINGFYPDPSAIAKWVKTQGTNGFYQSVEARKACCNIRKVEPLNRALEGASGWISGLRADQSQAREGVPIAEFDESRNLIKFNPLFDKNRDEILAEIKSLKVPINPLHDQGFLSIGCAPCTRAVANGETERAGRWWWEAEAGAQKECGLHVNEQGQLVRNKN